MTFKPGDRIIVLENNNASPVGGGVLVEFMKSYNYPTPGWKYIPDGYKSQWNVCITKIILDPIWRNQKEIKEALKVEV